MKMREFLSSLMKEAHRMMKVAGITLSEALKRSWALAKLVQKMKKGVVKFYFQKIDGTIREAWGTLDSTRIENDLKHDTRAKNNSVQTYWDTEKQSWRCFKKLNIVTL